MNRWRAMAGGMPKKESRRKQGSKRSCVDVEVQWRWDVIDVGRVADGLE